MEEGIDDVARAQMGKYWEGNRTKENISEVSE